MIRVDDHFKDRKVCILGLGFVGLTLGVSMADAGFDVVGVEIRDDVLASLKKGTPHFFEPGLKESFQRLVKDGRFQVEKNIPDNSQSTVYIITVGTPLDKNKKVRVDMIENVANEIGQHLKEGDFVILRSTVKVGTTRKIIEPILKKKGVAFDLAFCPERTLEGKALIELRQLPQIVGAASFEAAVRAGQIFQFLTPTVIKVGSPETAEMIKLIDNTQRDVFFSYANEVARLCDAAGVSATEVIQMGKLGYPRAHLAMPGPVGGPCLEKDSYILAEGMQEFNIEPKITMLARKLNESQPAEVAANIKKITSSLTGFPAKPKITLCGLAFKGRPATDDLRGTMARPILASLQKQFPSATFSGFDPMVQAKEIKGLGLKPVSSVDDAFSKANLVLLLNNHPLFSSLELETVAEQLARPGLIYDFWNQFPDLPRQFPKGTGYVALGSQSVGILPQ